MTTHDDLTRNIVRLANESVDVEVIAPFNYGSDCQNQFVFFFKPEVFLVQDEDKRGHLIRLTLQKFEQFSMVVTGCGVFSGGFLERCGSMDRHYGFINAMSRRASQDLQGAGADQVREAAGAPAGTPIMGGHEFMAARKLSAEELDRRWQEQRAAKVRSGLYVEYWSAGQDPVVLVNGFHPAQLSHFTAKDRRIGVMLLTSDLPWSFLRSRLIGDTFPERAAPGSLRRTFRDNAGDFGLGSVDITNNCVHLSAGPFEALFEMRNFLADVPAAQYTPSATTVGRLLTAAGQADHLSRALDNPEIDMGNLFDLTEGVDTRSAVALYTTLFR